MSKPKEKLKRLLDYFEHKIDLKHLETVQRRLLATIRYEPIDRPPLYFFLPYEGQDFQLYPYEEAYADPTRMMVNELLKTCRTSLYHHLDLPDDSLYCIEANFGVCIPGSMFGGEVKIFGDDYPWIAPMELKEIDRIINEPPPDPRSGLGQRVLDQIDYFHDVLRNYPKCKAAFKIEFPDPQGPFSVAEQLWGTDILLALYDDVEKLQALLAKIAETMIAAYHLFLPKVRDYTGSKWHYSQDTLEGGQLCVRNDAAINVSPDMYAEIIQPFDKQISEALEGISIHFCGNGQKHIDKFLEIPNLKGFDFGQGQLMDMDQIYAKVAPRKIPLVRAAVSEKELCAKQIKRRFPTGVTLLYRAKTIEKAHQVWRQYDNH